ncbi:MAG TPA: PilZ domain-containing protein [Terriglobales bacterium]|nr:PilZ domain-containing protein [Terriglobales bacterium]
MLVEQRRHIRHRMHSPAYASIGAGIGGVVLDANEHGAAIETISSLTPDSTVDLRLDLLDTRASALTPARVAWYDSSGRAGLEFLNLTGESRRQLQQWLLLNALLGTESTGKLTEPSANLESPRESGDDGLRELARRALDAAEAHGAAIALLEAGSIVCRATAGDVAPPLGTKLDTHSGISGACIRAGHSLRCGNPLLDPYVDRESCRVLGISSVMAVPIGERESITGLIEVFSRSTHAFSDSQCSAVEALAKEISGLFPAEPRVTSPAGSPPVVTQTEEQPVVASSEPVAERPATAGQVPAVAHKVISLVPAASTDRKRERTLFLGLLTVLAVMGLWLSLGRGPAGSKSVDAAELPAGQLAARSVSPAAAGKAKPFDPLQKLRQLAERGDADAQFELGAKYATGEGTAQDYAQAVNWFRRAADAGQVLAAATLAAYYRAGQGVSRDDVSAYTWSAIARQEGDLASKHRLAVLRSRMTRAQISQAEARAAAWQQAHAVRLRASNKTFPAE